ncbi:cysteine--tRNA ligase [candidate division WOR-3 bacterium 4484_100]|uniref:Cysteine--tRNA ligase n=1 Tax=candidate division WOR-3 bacterium 4484_100 TaxID=1936077 RepID=A0A1V4QGM2_UNCW3|nr:MAG: cysteine--tRNA ligase [candidate division WOR-3 bacterium 4484_100]
MGLRLFNTLSSRLEDFTPLNDNKVGIYTCGMTVQGPPHIGHIRAALNRDVLVRWLRYLGYEVISVENFTDVDDKIIQKQKEYKLDWRIIAQGNIEKYLWACDQLNIERATVYPRASQHIEEIIDLVQSLVDKGYAYESEGDVYYRVRNFPRYGRLSKKSIDELVSGARIEPTEHKKDPLDFAVWKSAKSGEPYWLSPWGKGRPGWHIECSAMSMHYLGETFDIHTGGEDLIFPHHENEIAQSEAATGKQFVRYWLHTGWVTLGGEKMAKSTGHFLLIEDLLKEYRPNVVRLYLLKTHYRNQIEFSRERLNEARSAYLRIQTYLHSFKELGDIEKPLMLEEFTQAMNDDLNTSRALGIIYELIKKGYEENDIDIARSVKYYLRTLGFKDEIPEPPFESVMIIIKEVMERLKTEGRTEILDKVKDGFLRIFEDVNQMKDVFPGVVGLILDVRNMLRKEKEYSFADYIRSRLADAGIQIQDININSSTYRLEVR